MKDDSKLQLNGVDGSTYSPKRRQIGSGESKILRMILAMILILVFIGGIFYFISKQRPAGDEASPLQLKVTALEEKIVRLEEQLIELQGKVSASGSDPALIQRVDALTHKIEALERQKQATAESKTKPARLSKPEAPAKGRYHTVQKGETLFGISKKYGISLAELRKQNNLHANQPLRIGQKLLVSPSR